VDFTKHLAKAQEALRRRHWDFAVDLYRQLLDLSPDLGEARAGLREALRRRHEAKPSGMFSRALGGAVPLGKAHTLLKVGRHDAAARALEDYLSRSPLDESANLMLGRALEAAGHRRSALAVYEFLAEIAPKNPEGLKAAGALSLAAGEHPKALGYYERALEVDPRDQEALKARKNLAAEAALSAGRFDQVGHSREQVVDAQEVQRLERRQRLHLSEEELRSELERLETRFAEEPRDVDLMLELSGVHERLGDPDAALEFAERARSYRKDDFELLCRIGDLTAKGIKLRLRQADKDGDRQAADRLERELLEAELVDHRRRVELRPAEPALRVGLARRLMRAEDWDGALAELQRSGGDTRLARDVAQAKGRCFEAKGFLDLAAKEYEGALEGLPASDERAKEILYTLGALAEREGDPERARSWYARLYEQDIAYRDVSEKMEALRRG
jgi:tetratricopeptide (TPR) repeat protein